METIRTIFYLVLLAWCFLAIYVAYLYFKGELDDELKKNQKPTFEDKK